MPSRGGAAGLSARAAAAAGNFERSVSTAVSGGVRARHKGRMCGLWSRRREEDGGRTYHGLLVRVHQGTPDDGGANDGYAYYSRNDGGKLRSE